MLSSHPLFGLGLNNFSVYYEFVTGRTNFGPHSFYVALLVETGLVGAARLRRLPRRTCSAARARARRIGRALAAARDPVAARVRPLAWGLTAALVSTLASNAFYLTMSFYYFFALALLVLAAPVVFGRRLGARVKVVVLTTSYPALRGRPGRDVRRRPRSTACARPGVEVEVVSPASFRHFGIAYGHGIAGNLRARAVAGWRCVPAFLGAYARAARQRRARTPTSSTRTGSRRARGARDREAVRRPALGHGRRAGAPRAAALPAARCGGRGS